jgi:hypothetical protein
MPKIHQHNGDFYGLIAGIVGPARESVADCLRERELHEQPDALNRVRKGIGRYKSRFAETHCQSRLGIS